MDVEEAMEMRELTNEDCLIGENGDSDEKGGATGENSINYVKRKKTFTYAWHYRTK